MRTGPADTLRVQPMPVAAMLSALRNHPALVREMRYPNFFASVSWLDAVLQYGSPAEAFGLAVFRADELVAMLPLETARNWLGGRDLRCLGYRFFPDPLGLVCAERDLPAAIAALIRYLRSESRWDRLILDFVLPEEAGQWPGKAQQQSQSPYISLPENMEALLAGFRREKRYKLRTKVKRAAEAGLTFTLADTAAEKRRYLDALFQLHGARSSEINRDSSIRHQDVQSLHARLAESCEEALLFALQAEDRFVAVLYGFLSNRRFSFFQIAHDPQFSRLSPGLVILCRIMAHLCETGASEFNFLQGDEAYKYEWTAEVRPLMQVEVGISPVRSKLLAGAGYLRRRAVDNGRALVNALRN